jgi:ABC-type transporter lipoprotein component MlaA/predicted esterase
MSVRWRNLFLAGIVLGALLSASCRSSEGTVENAETARKFDFAEMAVGRDPIEPVNRVLSGGEHIFLRWVFRPIGYVYGSIMPRPVITGFNNFTKNVGFPVPMFSSFLQGKFADGGTVFVRFLANTTMTAGFWDPADYWFGLRPVNEDVGQAFGRWGIGRGFYIGVPSMSGNNIRDTAGMIFDFALDPKTYVYGGQYFTFLNSTMARYDSYEAASMGNWDDYLFFRDIGGFYRNILVRDWDRHENLYRDGFKYHGENFMPPLIAPVKSPPSVESRLEPMPTYGSQGASTDTLRVAMCGVQGRDVGIWPHLSLWSGDLFHKFKRKTVEILPERRQLQYRFLPVEGEKQAPLVVLIPGLGGNNLSSMSEAIAEMLWMNGYSVVLISNPFSWEFIEAAGSSRAPGYAPDDAADLRKALRKVLDDIHNRYGIQPNYRVLAGYSLGGYYALIAAEQEGRENTLGFDRYLAINPPVNLMNGMVTLDEFYNTWRNWSGEEAYDRGLMAAAKYLGLLNATHQWEGYSPKAPVRNDYLVPVHNDEARMLIGYSFKRTLSEVLGLMKKRSASPDYSWGRRRDVYDRVNAYDFRSYAEHIIIPEVNRQTGGEITLAQLARKTSLFTLTEFLQGNPDVRVIHSADDFLESEAERKWLSGTLKDRIVFMQHGAHLGNLYTRITHDHILKMLAPKQDVYANLPYVAAP